MKQKKIGVLTLPLRTNYGCLLQAFALMTFLKSCGYNAYLINRRWDNDEQSFFHKIQKLFYHKIIVRRFDDFARKYIVPQTPAIETQAQMQNFAHSGFGAFIVGSDQVWRMRYTRGVGYNFFLDFVTDKSIKKVSYAASFGVDYWDDTAPEESIPIVRNLLSQFDAISVREVSGCDICRNIFNVDALHVLDPTMLINAEDYENAFNFQQKVGNYLAVYILDMTEKKKRLVKAVSNKLQLPVRYINESKSSFAKLFPSACKDFFKPGVEEWLKEIANSSYVLTDSFHGTIFSIIFKRQFLVIGNKHRGMSRFQSILEALSLTERMYQDDLSIILKSIDYENVFINLEHLRKGSISFIKGAI